FRGLLDLARNELVESLAQHGLELPRATAEAHIELLVAGVLGLLEGLLEERLTDRAAAIDAIAGATTAMFRALREREGDGPRPAPAAARATARRGAEAGRRSRNDGASPAAAGARSKHKEKR